MERKGIAFFSMVLLALALMTLIVITQFFTNRATDALTQGNIQAVKTFKINNNIQKLVNLSFDLQSKFSRTDLAVDAKRKHLLTDSLITLGYNSSVLTNFSSDYDSIGMFNRVSELIDSQVNFSMALLETYASGNTIKRNALADSLRKLKPGDKVYAYCIEAQKQLGNNLQATLVKNSEQADKLSSNNKKLAIFAIIAILLMATIIIRRQSQQLRLIEELKAAEMAALRSKNAKDEFLANMSHELRTPLNALIGFSNLFNDTPLNSQQKEYIDIIRSNGYNLLNIVNDVLDLSKIEAGKLKIDQKPFSLPDFFTNLEKMFSKTIREKNLTYTCRIDKAVPEQLIGDKDRLQQIFVNLIGNAIKFTHDGDISVTVDVVWVDDEKKFYKLGFTVKDTGVGIPKDKVQTIFERFEQLEQGSQKQYGGTGLGLTIVKNLIEKMGGSISVYSEVDTGSEFNFTCIFEQATPDSTLKEDTALQPGLQFNHCSILIVEDNKANQVLLKYILNKYGLTPELADNGIEAIELLKVKAFDLVLMDIQMPKMDGYTAIEKVRNTLRLKTPAIAMTAYVLENEINKCYHMGFDDYLAKPINEKMLVEKISKYISGEPPKTLDNQNGLGFLKELIGDDPQTIHEILNEMKLQWDTDKADLSKAMDQKDLFEINRILHRVKSTFSPLGPGHTIYKIIQRTYQKVADTSGLEVPNKYAQFIKEIDTAIETEFKY